MRSFADDFLLGEYLLINRCRKCNSELTDTRAEICRDCENAARQKQESRYARKRKGLESVIATSIEAMGVDEEAPVDVATDEPEYGRCTICFKNFYGVGRYCESCNKKLNLSTEEWEAEEEKRRKNRETITLRSVVGIALALVLVSFGLWLVRTEKRAQELEANAGTASRGISVGSSARAAYNAARTLGVNSITVDSDAQELEQANYSQISAYNLIRHLVDDATQTSTPLANVLPAAIGAGKFGHGDMRIAFSLIDTIAKYQSADRNAGLWTIAANASNGLPWSDDLQQLQIKEHATTNAQKKAEFDDLNTVLSDLAQNAATTTAPAEPNSETVSSPTTVPGSTTTSPQTTN